MSNKKYSKEFKLKLLKEHEDNGVSFYQLEKENNISFGTVRHWLAAYKKFGEDGLVRTNSMLCKYSSSFKQQVVQEYLSGGISTLELAHKHGIRAESTVSKWIRQYNSHEELTDSRPEGGGYLMTKDNKPRKTTRDERIRIVEYCIANENNYALAAKEFNCSYGQVYSWVKKYEAQGVEGLYDRRGRSKPIEELTELEKLKAEKIDVTLPARKAEVGHRHPNQIALEEVERIFVGMGYEVIEGPEVEYDDYNFTKLNIPANHPAKDEQDTFYINKDIVLRTQTSPTQARVMEQGKLPIRMISPGRVFRSDEVDATHSPSFHQIEGLVVDKNITFADLKGTLAEFAREIFGPDTKTKFRPHHFPFTEPSAEMDVSCFKCGGKGCRFCKGEGWIEILGCGMVHPHVFEMCGIDSKEYTGFAFGVGLERIALLKYEIDDMRLLYENDIRFLKQF